MDIMELNVRFPKTGAIYKAQMKVVPQKQLKHSGHGTLQNVVIKVTDKRLHTRSVTMINGEEFVIRENIQDEVRDCLLPIPIDCN